LARRNEGRWRPILDRVDTLPKGRLEVERLAVLTEQIGEGLVGERAEIPHAAFGQPEATMN
jgi:hypothetical protein